MMSARACAPSILKPHNTLFFAAGPNKAANGLYGRIDLPAM